MRTAASNSQKYVTEHPLQAGTPALRDARIALIGIPEPFVRSLTQILAEAGARVRIIQSLMEWRRRTVERAEDAIIFWLENDQQRRGADNLFLEMESIGNGERILVAFREQPDAPVGSVPDFLVAPFRAGEVISRVSRVLAAPRPSAIIRAGNLEMDISRRTVTVGGTLVSLTFYEFEILHGLMLAQGSVVTRESLRRRAWPDGVGHTDSGVDIRISHLRSKLFGLKGARIDTLRSIGYRLRIT